MEQVKHSRWQKWNGAEVPGLGALPPGKVVAGRVRGWGDVHFTRSPKGDTLVHGPVGLGPAAASDLQNAAWDAASNAAQVMGAASDACGTVGTSGSAVNTAVHAFKVAWNAWQSAEVSPPNLLSYNGKWDTAAAGAMQSLLGAAPPVCAGGGPPPPPPAKTCPSGQQLDASGNCVPIPAPQTQPSTSNTLWYVLGGAGVLALLGVGWAVMAKPSSKELQSASQRHAHRATTHRQMSGHLRHAALVRAREEAAETRRRAA